MAALLWGAWGEQWALEEKVSFDGTAKTITVHSDVTALDIRSDVYSAWVRWTEREPWAPQAMRFSGGDPIPGGETGLTFFVINGWKLIYNPSTVAVAGVLYSADYDTAYWGFDGNPIYPATVSSLVNSAVSYQNVVTGDLSAVPAAVWGHATRTITQTIPTAEQNADAVRLELLAELVQLAKIAKLHGIGVDLSVSPTTRTAGDITQTITTVGDTTTVSAA